MNKQNVQSKLEMLNNFTERLSDVRLLYSINGHMTGVNGHIFLARARNGEGKRINSTTHYHISDELGAVPIRYNNITVFSLRGSKGRIRVDHNYGPLKTNQNGRT